MCVIVFSWEYPPRIVGKLAYYVSELAMRLASSGLKTHVVTYHDSLIGDFEEASGVKVHRVANPVKTHINLLTWAITLNQEVERITANIYYREGGQVDLIDVHEWQFIPAAVTIKRAFEIPFTYSVESIEDQRSGGASNPLNIAIKSIEQLGVLEADGIIVKSEWMKNEVKAAYGASTRKIKVANLEEKNGIKAILDAYKSLKR